MHLKQIWLSLRRSLEGDRSPQVAKKQNSSGDRYFELYDPVDRKVSSFSSSREIQIWLDQHHL
ncbi:hypothetical protein ACN4EG_13170 [Alkalinema pantanalense CENA528]|uniref:hypothetical protein n=1 Tax=Alkalinema pantanalense TaxID=1620705 RepID=UPI003D6EBEE9